MAASGGTDSQAIKVVGVSQLKRDNLKFSISPVFFSLANQNAELPNCAFWLASVLELPKSNVKTVVVDFLFTGCPSQCSDAIRGWAVWVLAHPEFWSSGNQRADYAHHNIACPPGFNGISDILMASYARLCYLKKIQLYINTSWIFLSSQKKVAMSAINLIYRPFLEIMETEEN